MKPFHKRWTELFDDCVRVALVCGTVGIAAKFVSFFNHWVFFPIFPNLIDSAFLIFAVMYLAWLGRGSRRQQAAEV